MSIYSRLFTFFTFKLKQATTLAIFENVCSIENWGFAVVDVGSVVDAEGVVQEVMDHQWSPEVDQRADFLLPASLDGLKKANNLSNYSALGASVCPKMKD